MRRFGGRRLRPRSTCCAWAVRHFIVTGDPGGLPLGPLRTALGAALDYALAIVIVLAIAGAAISVTLLLAAHVPIRKPDLARLDDGQPALSVPT